MTGELIFGAITYLMMNMNCLFKMAGLLGFQLPLAVLARLVRLVLACNLIGKVDVM
jgi:hypothetical protein